MADTTLAMFRAARKDEFEGGVVVDGRAVQGVLYPDFEPRLITGGKRKGQTRPPDIRPFKSEGLDVVDPDTGGTSLFDKTGLFGATYWWYFTLPKETPIPASLKIVMTGHNQALGADHYQIEPSGRMEVTAFKGALDTLARNAIEKAYRDARR